MRTLYVLNIIGLILFFTVVESKRIKEEQLKKNTIAIQAAKFQKNTSVTKVKSRIIMQQLFITVPIELPAQLIIIRLINSK
jgi:formate/nitrite transporter FocA (FNT family)